MGMSKSNPSLKPQVLINYFSGSIRKVKCAAFLARRPPDMIDLNGDFEKAVYNTLKQIR